MGGEAGTFGEKSPPAFPNLNSAGFSFQQLRCFNLQTYIYGSPSQKKTEVEYIVACFEHISSMCCNGELQLG